MASIPVNSKIQLDLQSIIDGISNLETRDLESFAKAVNQILAHRKAPALSERETELLLKINQGLPSDWQERYFELIEKSEKEVLSRQEIHEYQELASKAESIDALRLQSLIELAQLRNISPEELLDQLNINLSLNG